MMEPIVYVKTYPVMPPVNRREILRYMRCSDAAGTFDDLVDMCLDEMLPQLVYKVCWRVSEITRTEENPASMNLGFMQTSSLGLSRNLSSCDRLVIFAATVGLGPDRLIAKYGRISPTKALCMQAIGAERIESLCDLFCEELAQEYAAEGCFLRPRFSPGYGDFSLDAQRDVFRALDCHRKIGLSLNDSLLMSPSKSVTALVGLSRRQPQCENDRLPHSENDRLPQSENDRLPHSENDRLPHSENDRLPQSENDRLPHSDCSLCDKTDCLFRSV